MVRSIICTVLLFLSSVQAAVSQRPVEVVTLGWAIDTTGSPVREIVRTLLSYFRLPHPGRTATPFWSAEEQARLPYYDLTADLLYQGFPATVVEVTPAVADSSLWVVKTLFARADSNGTNIQPLGLQRLYARRSANGWQLGSALPVLTERWREEREGGIVYHYDPTTRFDRARARLADRFMDSAAAVLGVPRPARVDYYLAGSFEAVRRLQGLDWALNRAMVGGQAIPEDNLLFSGAPAIGEAFTHELVHLVLAAYGPARTRHRFVEEGVATWLGGGSRDPHYRAYVQILARYQAAHPDSTLRDLLSVFGGDDSPFYASGAVVADAVFRRDGQEGIRRLLAISPSNDALLATLPGLLGISPDTLEQWWRAQPSRVRSKSPRYGQRPNQ